MSRLTADAVVIGSGPNGLVAATVLADAGWDVVVVEAAEEIGGAVRSSTDATPGFVHDLFSAFYPLAVASPVIAALELERFGLDWVHAPTVLAHPPSATAERAAVLHRDPWDTAAALESDHPGDGTTWLRLVDQWRQVRDPLLAALFTPFPPARAILRLLGRLGTERSLELARLLALPVHRLGEELFGGRHARLLLAGNAAHTDIPTVAPGSGAFGWLLGMLAQDVGFPVPRGGAGRLGAALADRARAAGVVIRTGARAERIVVRAGRALGVLTADGAAVRARRAVLATGPVTELFGDLLPPQVGGAAAARLDRFQWDLPTVKVNWALDGPVPWRAAGAATAGTVHLGADLDQLAEWSAAVGIGRPSRHSFAVVGQMAVADPSRAPRGGESLWAYGHLPRGETSPRAVRELADRLDDQLEAHAPGLHTRVVHRFVQGPGELQRANGSLVGGAVNGGTAQLHQQLLFRPVPGTGRPETVVERLYLAGAAAHPGGGVHGAAGYLAARAALRGALAGGAGARLLTGLQRRLHHPPR